jgi:hypothetical protein
VLNFLNRTEKKKEKERRKKKERKKKKGFFYLVGWDLTPIRSLCRSPRFV